MLAQEQVSNCMYEYSSELEAINGSSVIVTRSVVGQRGTEITLDLPVSISLCVVIVGGVMNCI